MSTEKQPENNGHRVESMDRAGITYTRDDGSQEIGMRALAGIASSLLTGRETKPTDPHNRSGNVFNHDDGSYDTGVRALANTVRVIKGEEPKVYRRTMRPL